MISEGVRAHFDHANPAVQRITIAHRDDLLFQLEQVAGAIRGMLGNLSLLEGGDEAILAGARSLEEMYPYQNAARLRNRMTGARASFFENPAALQTQDIPNTPAGTE
jgi:hypothetical protein